MRWIKRAFPGHPVAPDVTADDIVKDLKDHGITRFFNLVYPLKDEETDQLNEWNLEFCARTEGAIPFASMHADTADKVKKAEWALEAGFAGFKFHPFVQGFDPWDKRMEPLYSFLEEAGAPVLMHTGFEDFYNKDMPASELHSLMKRHPDLCAVFVHMAFPELDLSRKMLDEFEGLYLDATNVLSVLRPAFLPMLKAYPDGNEIPDKINMLIEDYRGRIMFGSDHPAGIGGLDDIYGDLDLLGVSGDALNSLIETPHVFLEKHVKDSAWKTR